MALEDRQVGATDKREKTAWWFWAVLAGLLVAAYVGTYLFLSRVTATACTLVTDKGERVVFVFARGVTEADGYVQPSAANRICYRVFWPLVFIDAATNTRYHEFRARARTVPSGGYDFIGWDEEHCEVYDIRPHDSGEAQKRESRDR